jgi:hypothetical protein
MLGFATATSLACFYMTHLFFKAGTHLFSFDHVHNIAAFPLLGIIMLLVGLLLLAYLS